MLLLGSQRITSQRKAVSIFLPDHGPKLNSAERVEANVH